MTLNIICALFCEAESIIQAHQLKKDVSCSEFQLYHNKNKSLCLIVSGIGKINAAIATAYLASYQKTALKGFLNIGMAGGLFDIGQLVLAEKLQDPTSKRIFYPKINFLKANDSRTLTTFDHPISHYPANTMVDMEAYGFYQAAMKFTTQEFIQVLKIISDNSIETSKAITPKIASQLVLQNMSLISDSIETMLVQLKNESTFLTLPTLNHYINNHLHVTQQQHKQLERLLQRAELFFDKDLLRTELLQEKSCTMVIKVLQKKLETCY